MKFLRFASLLWIVTIVSMAPGIHHARAADDDLPPPFGNDEEIPVAPSTAPPLQAEPPMQDPLLTQDPIPEPTLGAGTDDALPDPMGSGSQDNVVNKQTESDEIFLPPPASEGPSSAPLYRNNHSASASGSGSAGHDSFSRVEDTDWRNGLNNRPIVTLHAGASVINYPSDAVGENITGTTVGASIRLFDIGQTVFLHFYGSYTWASLGTVGPFPEVKDSLLHYGPMLEIGIGRRLSLYGAILRSSHTLRSDADTSTEGFGQVDNYSELVNEGWKPGIGIQYDFYVIPHGSLGIRGYVEQDMGLVALTMSLEPVPKKRANLNFEESL